MTRRIYKYPFDIDDHVEIEMPIDAEILHVECQRGQPCIWAIVEPDRHTTIRRFSVVGTGHILLDEFNETNHVATFQQGPFVWHLFERA